MTLPHITPLTATEDEDLLPPRSWRAPIALGVLTVAAALLFWGLSRPGATTLQLTSADAAIPLPDLTVPTSTTTIGVILLAVLAAVATWRAYQRKRQPLWLSLAFGVVAITSFLIWAGAGATLPVTGLLFGTLSISVPLIFGSLSGVISERVGVVNVAIEGQFLAGAFSGAVVASITGNAFAGLIAAMIGGGLVGAALAVFSIRYWVDQVIVSVVLNVLVTGLTAFLYTELLSPNAATLNSPPRFSPIAIPLLSDIPILGEVLFNQTLIVYLMYVSVVAIWFGLFHTRWGLRMRAVGEHPKAADTVGIAVNRTRFRNVLLGGVIAGLGGSYFTLGSVGAFNIEMTAGAGFIALAAVIFGRWDPIRSALAALLFGFASSLQYVLSIIGAPVPSELMLMLPYLVTIFAVAGLVGSVRGPAAAGKPYITA